MNNKLKPSIYLNIKLLNFVTIYVNSLLLDKRCCYETLNRDSYMLSLILSIKHATKKLARKNNLTSLTKILEY